MIYLPFTKLSLTGTRLLPPGLAALGTDRLNHNTVEVAAGPAVRAASRDGDQDGDRDNDIDKGWILPSYTDRS